MRPPLQWHRVSTTAVIARTLSEVEGDVAISWYHSSTCCAETNIVPGDSQEVNCPERAREATLGCGPDGPRNDMVWWIYTSAGTSTGVTKAFTPSIFSTFTNVPVEILSPVAERAVHSMDPSFTVPVAATLSMSAVT